jgi:hypothetical protein
MINGDTHTNTQTDGLNVVSIPLNVLNCYDIRNKYLKDWSRLTIINRKAVHEHRGNKPAFLEIRKVSQNCNRLCGQVVREFLATDPEARVRFPALPE